MTARFSRPIAAALSFALALGAMTLSTSGAVARPLAALDEAPQIGLLPPNVKALAAIEALAKEQAMSTAQLIDRWTPYIKEASGRFKISTNWIKAVMRIESGGRTLADDNQPIMSSAGAIGIMQVMPETYEDMRAQYGLGKNPHDPRDNILAGTAYLSWLKEKYGYPKMFAAYNAGPATLEAHGKAKGKAKLPKETRDYIKRISTILGFHDFTTPSPVKPQKIIATLTRPGGTKITIDGGTVDKIRAAFPNEFVPGVQTVVVMGQKLQGVIEDVATVTAALKPRVAGNYLPGA